MRSLTLLRLALAVVLAGAGLAGVTLALVPEAVQLATAHHSTSSLPDLDPLAQRSVVYAADHTTVLAVLNAEENRKPVTLDRVPQPVVDVVLAVEDADFYKHTGVNARSITRALLANVSAGGIAQGGSTITQQVVKNALLTPKQDADRKVKEAVYALRLEKAYTKDQILERYLNTVYLGNGAYGLQAGAEVYFAKDVGELTVADAALLAALIRNPVGYDPFRFPETSRARRTTVLGRLVGAGLMTRAEADEIEKVPLPRTRRTTGTAPPPLDYFVEEVKQQLLRDKRLGQTTQERYNAVFRGGLQVFTTFDPRMQAAALAARDEGVAKLESTFTAALVAVEPRTGAVRAMVGGPGFDKFKFNLATQGTRQPGSSFKTFVLTAAIEAGARPDDLIDGNSPCTFPNPPQPDYVVRSASGGVAPLTRHIASSINCAFVRLGLIVGTDKVVEVAQRLGISSKLEPFPSISLGSEEVSPLEMASAYGVLAADGVRHEPYYIDKVTDASDRVIFEHEASAGEQVVDAGVARTVTSMLRGVVTGGTGTRAKIDGRQVAGKTGTAQDSADAWFVGYTPQLATAVWLGAPEGRIPMVDASGREVFGGVFAAPIFQRFMAAALEPLEPEEFNAPPAPAARAAGLLYLPGVDCALPEVLPEAPTDSSDSTTGRATTSAPPKVAGAKLPMLPVTGWTVVPCAGVDEYLSTTTTTEPPTTVADTTAPPSTTSASTSRVTIRPPITTRRSGSTSTTTATTTPPGSTTVAPTSSGATTTGPPATT